MSAYYPRVVNRVDSNNSSTTILTANSVFTGLSTEIQNYGSISICVIASSSGILRLQQSTNGVDWDTVKTYSVISNVAENSTVSIASRYYRLVYTNGSIDQTYFRLQSLLQVRVATNNLDDEVSGELVTTRDYASLLTIGPNRNLYVTCKQPKSSFGDIRLSQLTPTLQINFAYGLNTNLINSSTLVSGSVTATNGLAVISSGATTNSSATMISKRSFKHRNGQGGVARFSAIFTTGVLGSTQLAGIGTTTDGYFFGYNDNVYGILYRSSASGVAVDTWIPQSSWNVNKLSTTEFLLDPTKGNVYQIVFDPHGYGNVLFYVFSPETSDFALVHVLKYANVNSLTATRIPVYPFYFYAANTTNSTNVQVSSASIAQFTDGIRRILNGGVFSLEYYDSLRTSYRNTITLQNPTTLNGQTNYTTAQITHISISGLANSNIVNLVILINPTLGGTLALNPVPNATLFYDIIANNITGGIPVFNLATASSGSNKIDLRNYNIYCHPGDLVTIATKSSTNTNAQVTVSWSEDI